jgi:DNA topoisomerase I
MKILVIVESSTKAKVISKYLNSLSNDNYIVLASNGHICDLIKKKLGLNENLEPVYELISSKSKTVKTLKDNVKNVDKVLLASDNDREGEAIAWHLVNILKPKNYKRIVFNEITKEALKNAVNNQLNIDMNLVDSQQARRVLDRVVGFKLTQMLWKVFTTNSLLTAGRVQSVVLKIIIDKENEIKNHVSSSYWNVYGSFDNNIENAKLYKENNVYKFNEKEDLLKFFKTLHSEYTLGETNVKKVFEKPDPPFTTSTLQQRAYNELGFGVQKTMKVAQELYENGHITYMRTDSVIISEDAVNNIRKYIENTYNKDDINLNVKVKKNQKNAQEAHEAIRPTKIFLDININAEQRKLYELIFKRTVASQMTDAIFDEVTIIINNQGIINNKMYFLGKTKILIDPGYKKVYGESGSDKSGKDMLRKYSQKKFKAKQIIGNHIWSVPPQRYNESGMIKKLEELGIGRPSTYASIMNKLYERQYINKANIDEEMKEYVDYIFENGKINMKKEKKAYYMEKNKLVPSEIAFGVNEFLNKYFSDIVNIEFTSIMENDLDKIAQGNKKYMELIGGFYNPFDKKCKSIKLDKTKLNSDNRIIKINGKEYIVRSAKFGPVIETELQGKKKFYNLRPYMNDTRKTLEQIDKNDILLIISMPRKVFGYEIKYARYGFYTEEKGKIYGRNITRMLNNDFDFLDNNK